MEKHFRPYIILKNSPLGILLGLPRERKWMGVAAWRILPLSILIGLTLLISQYRETFSWQATGGIVVIGLLVFYMLSIKIIWTINITPGFIDIVSFRFLGLSETQYFCGQAKQIEVVINDGAKGGGIFYKLPLKNGKTITFMQQPTWLAGNEDVEFVSKILQDVTKLEVKRYGHFSERP